MFPTQCINVVVQETPIISLSCVYQLGCVFEKQREFCSTVGVEYIVVLCSAGT